MLEEVLDLLQCNFRQIRRISYVVVAFCQRMAGDGNDLLVLARVVLHDQDTDRSHVDDTARHQRPRVAHEHIDRVAVLGKRVGNETVVAGIRHRRIQESIDNERARFLVEFVLDRIAADGNLDNDIDVVGRIIPYTYGIDAHDADCTPGKDLMSEVKRLAAFTTGPSGGNPAGVWIGDTFPDENEMLRIAAEVGYSETVFVIPPAGPDKQARYFSPEAEVPFCGHATIAAGVQLGRTEGPDTYSFDTPAGEVAVQVVVDKGSVVTTLTSVLPKQRDVADSVLDTALSALNWSREELDDRITPVLAYAGAWHLVVAVSTRERLARLDYDFDKLKSLMLDEGLTTLQLIYRENEHLYYARDPFPVGGVVEDPATGAAAAALGGYLRDAGLISAPANFVIRQGDDMGRPSVIEVHVPESGGIEVAGTAVDIDD